MAGVLEGAAQRHGRKPFLRITRDTAERTGIEAGDLSYAEAWERTQALIAGFSGIADGGSQRVALLLENRPEMFLHWLALNALGISAAPLNPAWRSAELGYALAHSEARLVIALPERVDALREVLRAEGLKVPVCAPGEDIPKLPSRPGGGRQPENPADRECALLYTSGTTGRPKGCMLSNRYFTMIGDWYTALGGLCALDAGGDCLITPLPMHHMNAMACSTMVMLVNGGCIVPLDRFHPRSWWREVRESGATIVHYLGVMPAILLKLDEDPAERRHGVRFGFGAGVGSRQHVPFEERFGFPLVEAWAMTETGASAAIIANREPRKQGTACFGRPLPAVDVRIVDDRANEVDVDQPGELWVRHAGDDPRGGFFSGYFRDAAATDAAWEGGWFHTGDIVARDADGDMHFIDRKSNMIRRSGENIAAVEVEGVLAENDAVAEAGVVAAPDEIRGDEVFACIRLKGGSADSGDARALAEELVRYCLKRLAYFKAPGYVAFADALPHTATEKLDRAALKSLAADLLDRGDCVDTRKLKRPVPSRAA
ncbi:MAG: ATP-dependent acyl-CoA ligase [Gammaproteobacteria bacterium]|nr:ATP-dependent acyl-CoA ligase [Gammaproteobacteria bacterium]MYF67274.1 ATP-dependent acyl-CoA ligase [Gammaproteobacteria bacterium]MYK36707.1 ATP-dependent acyl-CoA ligase [Gammaproteobacteria bacterium]